MSLFTTIMVFSHFSLGYSEQLVHYYIRMTYKDDWVRRSNKLLQPTWYNLCARPDWRA